MRIKISIVLIMLFGSLVSACGSGGSTAKLPIKSISIPTNLTLTPSDAQVTLNWSSTETKHRVHYATESFADSGATDYSTLSGYVYKDISTGTRTVISNLTKGVKYYFVVTAIKDGKQSKASNEVSSRPSADVIKAPTKLTLTPSDAQVTLNWSSTETKHRVHYATESFADSGSTDYSTLSGYVYKDISTGTRTVISNLTKGVKYYFVVTAIKDGKQSKASNEVSSRPSADIIKAPTKLTLTPSDAQVTLNWSSTETKHRVHYATESFADSGAADYSTLSGYVYKDISTGTRTVISNLTKGVKYYFVVTAIKDGKQSKASNEVSSINEVNDPSVVNILNYFDQETIKNGSGVSIILTYKKDTDINFRNGKIIISGDAQYQPDFNSFNKMSWTNPTEKYTTGSNGKILTTMVFDTFAKEDWVDTLFGGKGNKLRLDFWPMPPIVLENIRVIQIIPGKTSVTKEDPAEAKPNRANPVNLKVKGWPITLAMGTVTDNSLSINQNFLESKVDAIFKYEGDGFGDRGDVIEPIVTTQTIRQAREIEALDPTGNTLIMPTLVVYTANGSGGGLAPNDIKINYKTVNGVESNTNTVLADSNLVKHYRNTIRMAANMQANKDGRHPYPATIVLDADLFGEWQKNKLNGTFQNEYCGGSDDVDCESYQEIKIREAMKVAIEAEEEYMIKKYSRNSDNANRTESIGALDTKYNLDNIKNKITDTTIKNNIKGWVQSQNFIIKEFAPDVPFGWVINLWNPGSAHWVHKKYTGERDVWNNASKGVAIFVKWIGAYDAVNYRPDFLTFDKYERDGFGAAGKPSYAFSSRAWDNYLIYVKQITDFLDTPAMLWQIPGGHMVTKTEDLSGKSRLCTDSVSSGCFRHLDTKTNGGHSASGGSYFMGDKKIGMDINNIRQDVLDIVISGTHYNGASNIKELLNHDSQHNWGVSELRHAIFSNAFAILWGGGETTGAVPISTNQTGGYDWLKKKIVNYKDKGGIPLYHQDEGRVSASAITSLVTLNESLENAQEKMNNDILRYNTGTEWISSTIYKWEDLLTALKAMHNTGIAGDKYWLFDESDSDEKKQKYAKVAIAAFLAQSMQETIQYNACDENSWQLIKDAASSQAVADSVARGDFSVDYPMDAACGQLGQVYADYGIDSNGADNPYSCPRTPKMEVTAITSAKYYGAPAPIFSAPDAVLEDLSLLLNDKAGRWKYTGHCNGAPANTENFKEPTVEGWLREECKVYKGQKAGGYVWDGSSKRSLQGCGWWGRGVIQTTGRENFGKLNHFIGRSHVDKELFNTDVSWANGTVNIKPAPKNPLYADMDFCSNPELVCSSTKHKEIKWIAGLFFWMNAVQSYDEDIGKYKNWNYVAELKKYVNSNFGENNYTPLNGISFIDSVSGIVNRGCPDSTCPISGEVDAADKRENNFKAVLDALGIAP